MENMWSSMKMATNRRSFLKNGLAVSAGVGLLTNNSSALADDGFDDHSGRLTRGDAALLRFAAAAEILETDFWVQYNELGGIQDKEEPGGSGNPAYTAGLAVLDADMAQYIHDNTDDEFTHQNFLNAYLASKGAAPVNLEQFRTLQGSTATGSSGKLRLTNLMQTHAGYELVDSLPRAAAITLTSIRTSPSRRRCQLYLRASIRQFPGRMPIPQTPTSFRRSPIRPAFTSRQSNKAATVSILRWRREPPAWRSCES